MELTKLRRQIDEVDDKIVALLKERMEIVEQVARYKKANGVAVLDRNRETELLNRLCMGKTEREQAEIRQVYAAILMLSKQRQHDLL